MSFCKNGIVAKTSPRTGHLVVLNRERAWLSFIRTLSSSLTKSKMNCPGIYLFLVLRLNLQVKSRIRSRTQSPQAFWSAGRRQERLWRIRKNLNILIGCCVSAPQRLPLFYRRYPAVIKFQHPGSESLLATNRWPKSRRTLGTRLSRTRM